MAWGVLSVSSVCDVLLIIIFVVATASNSLVLLVFYRKPGLRTLSNRFVINLLVTNLLTCWLLAPLVLVDSFLTPSSQVLCALSQGVSTGLSAASVLSVLLIAVDQYYAVIDPLHYHSHIDNTKCGIMISVSWSCTFLWGVAGGIFYDTPRGIWTSYGRQLRSVPIPYLSFITETYVSVFSVTFSFLTFAVPFAAICWMYLSIYFAAHENSQRTRRNGSSTGFYSSNTASVTPPVTYAVVPAMGQQSSASEETSDSPRLSVKSVDVADPAVFVKPTMTRSPTRSSLRSTSSFIMNSLRCRISNASMFKYREETRAARISALVIVMGLVCWCPFSLVVLLGSPLVDVRVPHHMAKLSVTMLVVASVVSPLLFAHRNRRIQRDLRKLFGMTRRPTGLCPPGDRHRTQAQRPRGLPTDFSHMALDLLAEGGGESNSSVKSGSFLSRVWWEGGVSSRSLICVPEVAVDVDHSRSSFSSGGSASTQRSTSAASISSVADEY